MECGNSLLNHGSNTRKRLQFAIENGPVEIVDLPSYKMVDLSSSLCKCLPGRVRCLILGGVLGILGEGIDGATWC